MSTLIERISQCLVDGRNQAGLAKACGIKAPSVSAWLSGKTKKIEGANLLRAAIYLNVYPEWLATGLGPMQPKPHSGTLNSDDEVGNESGLRTYRRLPIVGEVQGGDNGYLMELEYPVGQGDGYVEWPTRDTTAYAVRVRGDSMYPRYRAGEFVIVEPSIEPQPQDDVIVVCVDGRKMLKLLNWINADEVQLLSLNNGYPPITLQRKDITSLQLASGRAPRSALNQPLTKSVSAENKRMTAIMADPRVKALLEEIKQNKN